MTVSEGNDRVLRADGLVNGRDLGELMSGRGSIALKVPPAGQRYRHSAAKEHRLYSGRVTGTELCTPVLRQSHRGGLRSEHSFEQRRQVRSIGRTERRQQPLLRLQV